MIAIIVNKLKDIRKPISYYTKGIRINSMQDYRTKLCSFDMIFVEKSVLKNKKWNEYWEDILCPCCAFSKCYPISKTKKQLNEIVEIIEKSR